MYDDGFLRPWSHQPSVKPWVKTTVNLKLTSAEVAIQAKPQMAKVFIVKNIEGEVTLVAS